MIDILEHCVALVFFAYWKLSGVVDETEVFLCISASFAIQQIYGFTICLNRINQFFKILFKNGTYLYLHRKYYIINN